MTTHTIREAGKNGKIEITPTGIVRTIKRTLAKDDEQFIPFRSIVHVKHDNRFGRVPIVTIHTAAGNFEWKTNAAADIVKEVQAAQ